MKIVNVAAYKFISVSMEQLGSLQHAYSQKTKELKLKGTILLSVEGINLMLAGTGESIQNFQQTLAELPEFSDLTYKYSFSNQQPFKRMFVKIKKEIITFGIDTIKPEKNTAPYIKPETLKQWYAENKDMLLLDTRNTYEINHGSFEKAIHLNIESFTEFSSALKTIAAENKNKPVVTFCTGGIRCEKAAALLLAEGFKKVYQLEGGILNYFSQCGGEYYQGNCFVFDDRIAVDAQLQEIPRE